MLKKCAKPHVLTQAAGLCLARVVRRFSAAFKHCISHPEPALGGGTGLCFNFFQQPSSRAHPGRMFFERARLYTLLKNSALNALYQGTASAVPKAAYFSS
jgi:hypothetical protein